jgi:hemerythrin-like metal-binding protein
MALCNELGDCIVADGPESDAKFHEILNELADYARQHFASEEELVRRHAPSQLAAQIAEHEAYFDKITNILFDASGGVLDKAGLQRFLAGWWSGHILVSDLQLRDYFLDAANA